MAPGAGDAPDASSALRKPPRYLHPWQFATNDTAIRELSVSVSGSTFAIYYLG